MPYKILRITINRQIAEFWILDATENKVAEFYGEGLAQIACDALNMAHENFVPVSETPVEILET